MSFRLRWERKRLGLPTPIISKARAIELAIVVWELDGNEGPGSFSTAEFTPWMREHLDHYTISFGKSKITNMVDPLFSTVYHVNNQTGEVCMEQIDRWARGNETDRQLLRPASSPTDTLLAPAPSQPTSRDALLRSCEGDEAEGEGRV